MTPALVNRYIARLFLLHFLAFFLLLMGLVYFFDTLELLRQSSKYAALTTGFVLQLAFLKLPQAGQQLLPYAVLFGALFTYWRLNRNSELTVMRSAGLSLWQMALPALGAGFLLGVANMTVLSPVTSVMLAKYETLENRHIRGLTSHITISATGFWLRQPAEDNGYALIHAGAVDTQSWTLDDVIVLFFTEDDSPRARLDAQTAVLQPGQWDIRNATLNTPREPARILEHATLKTDLTPEDIEDSFASPETLSFWNIPEYIRTMEETGVSTLALRLHYQGLLSLPVLYAAMVLLATAVAIRPVRQKGTLLMIVAGLAIGFLVFFLEGILHALGLSQKLSPYLAAWAPSVVSFLLGTATLLYQEEG